MSHNMTAGRLLGAAWQCICVTRCRTEVVLLFVGSRDGKWLLFHLNESAFLSEAFLNNDKWKVHILYTEISGSDVQIFIYQSSYIRRHLLDSRFKRVLRHFSLLGNQDGPNECIISIYHLPYINSLKKPFRYKKASSLSTFTLWRTWQISNNIVTNVLKNTTQI